MPTSTGDVLADPSLQASDYDSLFLTTDDLPEEDRLATWHEIYGKTLFNLGMAPHAGTTFHADALIHRVGNISLATCNSSQVQYYTDAAHLQNAQDSIAIFSVLRGKAHGRQHGKDAIIGPGEGFAILNSEIASVNALEDGTFFTAYVPRELISPMLPDISRSLMQPIALNSAALKLMIGYAGALQKNIEQLNPALRHTIASHISDLTACILGGSGDGVRAAQARGLRAARLHAIKEDIQAHLTDHTLSAEVVAQRQGVSSRYIRKILDDEGTTFSDLVLRLRLFQSRRLLCDPRYAAIPVNSIAYKMGFGDLSYFNRTFRRQFGMTPKDVRQHQAHTEQR